MALTREMTIIAQDPSIKNIDGKILRTKVQIPYEDLGPGPRGYRIHVVDYDASQQILYHPIRSGNGDDLFDRAPDKKLLEDPAFHAQNLYAIVMRLLARFEAALGRRVSWSFGGHQINIVPHAFVDTNAFYSEDARGLYFGYFAGFDGKAVFTCLSHDVVAHEATHALLDGLRENYTLPSHPDQAGFHEGFSDIVALLSVFGLKDVVRALLPVDKPNDNFILKKNIVPEKLKRSVLMGLAEQFGKEASRYRYDCLRRSVELPPSEDAMKDLKYEESHMRGEILVAAVLNSFINVWTKRIDSRTHKFEKHLNLDRIVEDGVDAAEQLLTMCIRALDYCPAIDINFSDFLSAFLTADYELLPDDGKYKYREVLVKEFDRWGIKPASGEKEELKKGIVPELGLWVRPKAKRPLNYDCVHHESLERNPEEIFRFLWENRNALGMYENAYTWVISVRPCIRTAPDGFILRETVSEYRQAMDLEAGQLEKVLRGMKKPRGMPDKTKVRLNGGGVLIFDEFGHLKYHIRSRINSPKRQSSRLDYLWRNGIHDRNGRYGFSDGSPEGQRFAFMHKRRDGLIGKSLEWD